MQNVQFEDLLILTSKTVKDAMKQLDVAATKVLFAVDESRRLAGSLSDGDIRRHILDNHSLEDSVLDACRKDCLYLQEDTDRQLVWEQMEKRDIELAPVIDRDGIIIDVVSPPQSHKRFLASGSRIDLPVVIMAGGKGTRMAPFTNVLPKPLIPIGEKTILEIIIDSFRKYGMNRFYFTLNYRGEMIRAYFDGIEKDYTIEYVWEKKFNGTAASISLIAGLETDFIVSNCDIIVKADYSRVHKFHREHNAYLTVISSIQHHQFPYGVIDFRDGGEVTSLREKPEFTFPINTGVYILSPECMNYIPKDDFFHMTHLIEKLISEGKKVVTYPVNANDFIDIGQWDEYRIALQRLL